MSEPTKSQERWPEANWHERLLAPRRVPPVFRMVWASAPNVTASENIGVGKIEEANNTFRIRAAAVKTFAEKVIHKLPKGYDQVLGLPL
jgi:hypothetical protein